MTEELVVEVEHARVEYSKNGVTTRAVEDVSFSIQKGEFVAIVGPSGSGKSTLLNAIAGLVKPSGGSISLSCDPRDVGYMFQSDALLPWRRATDNVALTLELGGIRKKVARQRAIALLRSLGLSGFEDRYPHELSGGMRKRVSLAAALIHDPSVILMDEPYGALDAQTRLLLQEEFRKLWLRERQTILLVTHDLEEAVAMADRVVVLSARPAVVRRILDVDLDRDRGVLEARSAPRFHQLVELIWNELQVDTALAQQLPPDQDADA